MKWLKALAEIRIGNTESEGRTARLLSSNVTLAITAVVLGILLIFGNRLTHLIEKTATANAHCKQAATEYAYTDCYSVYQHSKAVVQGLMLLVLLMLTISLAFRLLRWRHRRQAGDLQK